MSPLRKFASGCLLVLAVWIVGFTLGRNQGIEYGRAKASMDAAEFYGEQRKEDELKHRQDMEKFADAFYHAFTNAMTVPLNK